MNQTLESFFKDNERTVNTILSKILFCFIPFFLIIILVNLLNIKFNVNTKYTLILCGVYSLFCVFFYIFQKKYSYSSVNKYILIIFLDL